jgi:hypothetical protein
VYEDGQATTTKYLSVFKVGPESGLGTEGWSVNDFNGRAAGARVDAVNIYLDELQTGLWSQTHGREYLLVLCD